MSWMDSWSRPTKHAVTPPPLYLTAGEDVPYCHSCGRVIGSRKSQSAKDVKYCSSRCRNTKPGPLDRKIEAAFVALLNGQIPDSIIKDGDEATISLIKENLKKKKKVKGDPRIVVECSEVEAILFQHEKDPEKVYGRKKNRAARGFQEKPEDFKSVDMVDQPEDKTSSVDGDADLTFSEGSTVDEAHIPNGIQLESAEGYGGGKIRPPQEKSDVNGSVGGEKGWAERLKEETEEMKTKRLEGERRAKEKEMVKRAARRGCAFGFLVQDGQDADANKGQNGGKGAPEQRRKCEAIMKGAAVEASYAKGEWGIRWREKS